MQAASRQSAFLHLLQHASRSWLDKRIQRTEVKAMDLSLKANALDKTQPHQERHQQEEDIKR
jgi:hypothetical protein